MRVWLITVGDESVSFTKEDKLFYTDIDEAFGRFIYRIEMHIEYGGEVPWK